jgi:hypothetical protein
LSHPIAQSEQSNGWAEIWKQPLLTHSCPPPQDWPPHSQIPFRHVTPAAQALPQAPQLVTSLRSSTQWPPQQVCPLGQLVAVQTQLPPVQVGVAAGQRLSQTPQLVGSIWGLTQSSLQQTWSQHAPPQQVWPAGQQVPSQQVWPAGQQVPSQQVWPLGQLATQVVPWQTRHWLGSQQTPAQQAWSQQTPAQQDWPDAQVLSQMPQFSGSVCMSMH